MPYIYKKEFKHEEREFRLKQYKENKLKTAEEQFMAKTDGSVNLEYLIYQLFKQVDWNDLTREQIESIVKAKCNAWQADYEKVQLYLLFD
jgi:hypothetical protein